MNYIDCRNQTFQLNAFINMQNRSLIKKFIGKFYNIHKYL